MPDEIFKTKWDEKDGGKPEVRGDAKLESFVYQMLKSVGENPDREGLVKTPYRYTQAFKYLTSGYNETVEDAVNDALFQAPYSEMVIVKNIELYSLCEHHLLPFFGKAHVGYIPNGKIIGLSKIPRIVDIFSRRLQVQERLTTEISEALMKCLEPQGVGVVIEANHMCMMMRGVEKQNSSTQTSSMVGVFQNPATRAEFLKLLH